MPGTTPRYSFPYQTRNHPPSGHTLGEALAAGIETEISRMDTMPTNRSSQPLALTPGRNQPAASGSGSRYKPPVVVVEDVQQPVPVKPPVVPVAKLVHMPNPRCPLPHWPQPSPSRSVLVVAPGPGLPAVPAGPHPSGPHVSAEGGDGGSVGVDDTTMGTLTGANSSQTTAGQMAFPGGGGGVGARGSGGVGAQGGMGGNSFWGNGGGGRGSSADGATGHTGGGGGGAANSQSQGARSGGQGGLGLVVITSW
jgi:hypothetical protein